MLFDLQGKRRRVVQATYLTLAVLMGGGLVLFGIGSDSGGGGLLDAFSGGGGGNGNEVVEERVDRNEERVEANPRAEEPRKQLVRDYYQLAVAQSPGSGFPTEAQDELRSAGTHWTSYLQIEKGKPDPSLARIALLIFDPTGLDQPQQGLEAARILAEDGNDPSAYLQMVQYAALAGDQAAAKRASRKAVELAPKSQRKAVRDQIEQIQGTVISQQLQQGEQPGAGSGGGASGAEK